MSYAQAMKWSRKHPKGTRQTVVMSTGGGFWPSQSWLEDCYQPYTLACKSAGVKPLPCEEYYNKTLRGGMMCHQTLEAQVERTKYYNSDRLSKTRDEPLATGS